MKLQRWQFSLRSLLALMTALAVVLFIAVTFPRMFALSTLILMVVFLPNAAMASCELLEQRRRRPKRKQMTKNVWR
jgi:hypothetical protein